MRLHQQSSECKNFRLDTSFRICIRFNYDCYHLAKTLVKTPKEKDRFLSKRKHRVSERALMAAKK